MQKRRHLTGRYDGQPVRLVHVGRDLGEQLARREADRAGEGGFLVDAPLDPAGRLLRRAEEPLRAGEVDIGLVDRDLLDEGGETLETLHHDAR